MIINYSIIKPVYNYFRNDQQEPWYAEVSRPGVLSEFGIHMLMD